MLKIICLSVAITVALVASTRASTLEFDGRHARATSAADGGYRLHSDQGKVAIAVPPRRSHTASVMFDALFALAQQEMQQGQVQAIVDPAFNNGQPVPCDCYDTGARWPYVWTRDLSFAADLALAGLDPQRVRQALQFKLSTARDGSPGLFVAQDTGSGGSWPISSDRVVWFLAARHLLDDPAFAAQTWQALQGTLEQDRANIFDAHMGLYRGETSFLDWREQTYPDWTREDVRFIGESFALSTNVLHYQALRLAAVQARLQGDARASRYDGWADALAARIDTAFWREDAGQYMSYIGETAHPVPYAKYDLLGLSLGILAGALPEPRARRALAAYPIGRAGSPVVWPQEAQQPIYHNRAIWPFVSAYSLRAARQLEDAPRITAEVRSLMRGAALATSNMENYELASQAVHVDEGPLSGPVVNSKRQLWSVAGYLAMVREGIFGLQPDGSVQPKLPVALVAELFGNGDSITLEEPGARYVLRRPAVLEGELLVAGAINRTGTVTTVQLVSAPVAAAVLERPATAVAEARAPQTPDAPQALRVDGAWQVAVPADHVLWQDGRAMPAADGQVTVADDGLQHCLSLTQRDGALESLHSPTHCIGPQQRMPGSQRWTHVAGTAQRVRLRLEYDNPEGPINTGITAAVKRLQLRCNGRLLPAQTVAMPHSVAAQLSTAAEFDVPAGTCQIELLPGFNMSALTHFAQYTGGHGGREGVRNQARVHALLVAPVAAAQEAP